MDRFLSSMTSKVDKKGRVSIPASFRPVLGGESMLYTFLSIDQPVIEAGGSALIEAGEKRLEGMDPFSPEYEMWSFVLHGDSQILKLDGEGRVVLTENLIEHAGLKSEVSFVGRGHFFQMWEPGQFDAYRNEARSKVLEMRRALAGGSGARLLNPGGKNRVDEDRE